MSDELKNSTKYSIRITLISRSNNILLRRMPRKVTARTAARMSSHRPRKTKKRNQSM